MRNIFIDIALAPFRAVWGFLAGFVMLAVLIAFILAGTASMMLTLLGLCFAVISLNPAWLFVAFIGAALLAAVKGLAEATAPLLTH